MMIRIEKINRFTTFDNSIRVSMVVERTGEPLNIFRRILVIVYDCSGFNSSCLRFVTVRYAVVDWSAMTTNVDVLENPWLSYVTDGLILMIKHRIELKSLVVRACWIEIVSFDKFGVLCCKLMVWYREKVCIRKVQESRRIQMLNLGWVRMETSDIVPRLKGHQRKVNTKDSWSFDHWFLLMREMHSLSISNRSTKTWRKSERSEWKMYLIKIDRTKNLLV